MIKLVNTLTFFITKLVIMRLIIARLILSVSCPTPPLSNIFKVVLNFSSCLHSYPMSYHIYTIVPYFNCWRDTQSHCTFLVKNSFWNWMNIQLPEFENELIAQSDCIYNQLLLEPMLLKLLHFGSKRYRVSCIVSLKVLQSAHWNLKLLPHIIAF